MKDLWNKLNKQTSEQRSLWYTAALWSLLLWPVLILVSILLTPFSLYKEGMIWISLLIRIGLIALSLWGAKKIFLLKEGGPRSYNFWKHITGYAIVATYVFGILPQVVRDYNSPGEDVGGLGFVILIILSTLMPTIHFIMLTRNKTRLASGFFIPADLDDLAILKKDKTKQKAHRKALKSERTHLQNLWYEWLEPVIGAILWVFVINHFFFQLYQIPSESMVPTFLIKDRVIAIKSTYGPNIPLTNYKLPALSDPETGQIVTFMSPDMDKPNSDLRYKNVFNRVFQPFVYIITLTQVDIDSDDKGNPKARQLVKRVVGVPGEKICLLNDEVYKKLPDEEWQLMADIPGEEEFGYPSLYYSDYPNMQYQRINPPVRAILTAAGDMVEASDMSTLSLELVQEKNKFLSLVNTRGTETLLNDVNSFLFGAKMGTEEAKSQLTYNLSYMSWINSLEMSDSDQTRLRDRYEVLLKEYELVTFYIALRDLGEALELELDNPGYFSAMETDIQVEESDSPYDTSMRKANGVMKLARLKLYNAFLSLPNQNLVEAWGSLWEKAKVPGTLPGLTDFTTLSIYTDGIERPSLNGAGPEYSNYFEAMQFPEYPQGDEYLGDDDYFLMGDNRYNSIDSRLGRVKAEIYLDPSDEGAFSESVLVSWDGHEIPRKNIQGRVRAILFPFPRFRLF